MGIYQHLLKIIEEKGAIFYLLIDPDDLKIEKLPELLNYVNEAGVDALLIGGSLLINSQMDNFCKEIKKYTKIPLIIFPGSIDQVSSEADAILFLSLISGRNAEHLIGKHVLAAPIIKVKKLEPISTGYMIIESGKVTTAEYMSGSKPIPSDKPLIAAATALAGEYLGMKFIYLEAGSGALNTVPDEMVKLVTSTVNIPVIVGGGIRTPEVARNKVLNGAKAIVIGNHFENPENWPQIKEFAKAIHFKS
ncbi:MAG TPA: geranylgeranylglyceryl/heptaprenylglyceryl phosphate synthase [Ignavibacteriales bacterium]|jgi:putative glycerol-1-phosphate prenyltransferase|nr:geranylgeranylglyceryl/heptaprenylglyceryl phosphate synthase [Ignavibacteriales bacterium]